MNNKYIFILSLTFLSSLLLSLFSEGLKEKTLFNKELDKKKNLLQTIGIDTKVMKVEEIIKSFKDNISEITLDTDGNIHSDINHNQFQVIEDNSTGELKYYVNEIEYLPAFSSTTMNAFILPISGKGLWSSLYGYFAIYNSDRYGFNNPDKEWEQNEIEYLLVGDSMTMGHCVNRPDDVSSVLRKISNRSVLNLGYRGNGPLQRFF